MANKLTIVNGRLRVDSCGGALVLSPSTEDPCCCCPKELAYFPGLQEPDTWYKTAAWHDEDECYFQNQFRPDGYIEVTAVEPDDPNVPSGKNRCGLFKVTAGSNWFTQQVPVGTYVSRGERPNVLGAIWNPPAAGGSHKIVSNTRLVNDSGPRDPCKNFGDKIYYKLSNKVNE